MTAQEKLKQIKQSLRLLMNGVTAQSLREKGANYHLNWGANLLHLRDMAKDYGKDYDLAVALWKEDIRECKILATLIMPENEFPSDMAMLWIEQIPTQEIAETLCHNLLQYQDYASNLAFQMMAETGMLQRMCGFLIISRLFMKNMQPDERDVNEFVDQALTALQDEDLRLRHAAFTAMQRFAELSEMHLKIAKGALKQLDLDEMV